MEPPDTSRDPARDFEGWVIQTRLAQGLPARVVDVAVLARIADLLCNHQPVNHQDERSGADVVTREPLQSSSALSSRSQMHQPQRRVVVWGCKEHQTPAGEECQGCIDQGELFTLADTAKSVRRRSR